MSEKIRIEEFEVTGEKLIATVKQIIRGGNIRRVTIKSEKGESLIEFPLTLGVAGALILPQLAAVGAIAALVTKCSIAVEKIVEADE
ncbi:MAG: DUF4342 domain-containing protein [Hyphomicrobiaceae bacterium]|nr:DUF4342 domain-containing protein [Hyphomicrobiaceae bacterium]